MTSAAADLGRTMRCGSRPVTVGLAALALCLSGCALLPRLGPPPQVGPPYIPPPEPVWVVLDPALFQTRVDSSATPSEQTRAVSRRHAIGSTQMPADQANADSLPSSTRAALDTLSAETPEGETTAAHALSVDLPAADRRQLQAAAHHNLTAADSLARGVEGRVLSARDRVKLENALGLVRQAEDALRRGDLRAAANLAYKARLLAGEVAR